MIRRFSNLLCALTYRRGMRVRELMVIKPCYPETAYYVCPRCGITMEREFMKFCDRCGQRLDWTMHAQAKIIHPGKKSARAKQNALPQRVSDLRF